MYSYKKALYSARTVITLLIINIKTPQVSVQYCSEADTIVILLSLVFLKLSTMTSSIAGKILTVREKINSFL